MELAEESGVGTSDGSGSDEGPANCAGLHGEPSDGMSAKSGAEEIEESGGGTGNGIDDGAGLNKNKRTGIGAGGGLELLEGLGVGTGDEIKRGARELRGDARRAERRNVCVGRLRADQGIGWQQCRSTTWTGGAPSSTTG